MFVLSVPAVLRLTELSPHQELLRTGQLTRVTPMHIGKIIFVSHEWTSYDSPDESGEQLQCLQALLRRLISGKEDGVQSTWQQQLISGTNMRLRAADWKKHLSHMFVCQCSRGPSFSSAGPRGSWKRAH